MIVRKLLVLRGPNLWARVPVLEVWLDLGQLEGKAPAEIPGFQARMTALLASAGSASQVDRDDVADRLGRESGLEGVVALLVLAIQRWAGADVEFSHWRQAGDGIARLAVQYQDEEVGHAALEAALSMVGRALEDRPVDLRSEIDRLRELARRVGFGPNTAPIVAVAKARGIPIRRLNADSLIQLGYGVRQRRFQTAFTDRTSAIA